MLKRFWRRVWVWDFDSQSWGVVIDDEISRFDAFECVLGGPSWCAPPQPYVYEQWWSFTASTTGTDAGRWNYLGGRVNWGVNPVVG